MSSSETLLDPGLRSAALAPQPAVDRRPGAGLTVLAIAPGELPVAGYLLRHGEAVTLVDDAPDPMLAGSALAGVGYVTYDARRAQSWREEALERALHATVNAGFSPRAVESLPAGRLTERLGRLPRGDVGCVVVSTGSAWQARRLVRAAGAPVLVLRPRAAAAGGPAVLSTAGAARTVPAAARCLATDRVQLITRHELPHRESVLRAAAHPALVPWLDRLVDDVRDHEITTTLSEIDRATELAELHGLRPETALTMHPSRLGDKAAACEGLLVIADTAARRPPAELRIALRARRPVLVVPGPEPGRGA